MKKHGLKLLSILLELHKTDVPSVTIIILRNLHKKTVDNVYNSVYKSLFVDFL